MNKRPEINQEVYVLLKGELYPGKVVEFKETPLAAIAKENIEYVFKVLIEDKIYIPSSELCIGGIRKKFYVRSSSFHYEPSVFNNINWTHNNSFTAAFVFESVESHKNHIANWRKSQRDYHLNQAELYK